MITRLAGTDVTVEQQIKAAFKQQEGWNAPSLVEFITGQTYDPLNIDHVKLDMRISDILESSNTPYVRGRSGQHPNALPDAWYSSARREYDLRVW